MIAEQRGIMNICLTYNPGSSPNVDTAGHALQTLLQQPLQQALAHQQQTGHLALPGTAVTEEVLPTPAAHAGVASRQAHAGPPEQRQHQQALAHQQQAGQLAVPGTAATEEAPAAHPGVRWRQAHSNLPQRRR